MRYLVLILLLASCNPVTVALTSHYPEVRDSVIARGDCKVDTITTVSIDSILVIDTLIQVDTLVDTITQTRIDTLYKKQPVKVITHTVKDLSMENLYINQLAQKDSIIALKDSTIKATKQELNLVYEGAEKDGLGWKIFLFTTLSSIALLLRNITKKK